MIKRHVLYCDHCLDSVVEAGSNARERKPATVSHEFTLDFPCCIILSIQRLNQNFRRFCHSAEKPFQRCASTAFLNPTTLCKRGDEQLSKTNQPQTLKMASSRRFSGLPLAAVSSDWAHNLLKYSRVVSRRLILLTSLY